MNNRFNFFNNNRIYFYVILAYMVLLLVLSNTYKNIEVYENYIKRALFNEAIGLLDDTSSNVLSKIVKKNGKFVPSNIENKILRDENEKTLGLIKSKDIKSLYVLYLSGENYFFLLDTDNEEYSSFNEVFIVENSKVFNQVIKNQRKRILIQEDVAELSFTLLKPIVEKNKTVALLVIDYTENRLTAVLDVSVKVLSYLLILVLILIFLLIFYMISTRYAKYTVYHNSETNTLTRMYMIDNQQKINFKKYYVALADIDFFKRVNNRHGQKNGDKVITEIIKIIVTFLKRDDKFIQYSGEEFLLLLDKDTRTEKELRKLLEEIKLAVYRANFEIGDEKFNLSISMGVLLNTEIQKSLQDVIHKADTALYEAKHNGRNRISYFDISQPKRLYREKLKEMIESDKLVCYYQPIRDLETSALHHYEALLRIEDGDNIIFPDKILPDLEDSYLYTHLTKRVIEFNIDMLRKDSKMSISINLSADDLVNDAILSILAQNSDLSDRLLVEILENKSVDYKRVELSIQKLKLFGYKICIDDFGSGHSNLNHLLKLSIDFLKIDGSIIKEIHHDKRAYSLVKTFASFCEQNDIEVIAEFIDNQEVVDILKSFGVKFGQGWYFSKAEPYEALDKKHE
ncbi:MAG: diguanylate cyclase/phosphodiesterase (GGDEF & EAL domains) with PAS/PAC sensor(s) [uncultured Sulfurovum sp.]|uniref:Diguanylate cyclase/phosphodiesterase (GGDEF & EAL domains) with PAS/PAC sensor(S) n=1 Tax=uncultured Sulfurovum sp. TaxID=269237 RepID=A0A6S6TKA8_9BACT|nr:MAG: diguanylate cyclase/phosphodiesterase (GGDEF & EAL domains) with PAS/PAC sensor(s) [uncultured Sulfurovum sp.]